MAGVVFGARRSLSMGENSDDDDEGNIRAADGSSSLVGKWVVPVNYQSWLSWCITSRARYSLSVIRGRCHASKRSRLSFLLFSSTFLSTFPWFHISYSPKRNSFSYTRVPFYFQDSRRESPSKEICSKRLPFALIQTRYHFYLEFH